MLQSLEESNRALEDEISELRQLRDAADDAGDVREMQRELRVRSCCHFPHSGVTALTPWSGH